MHEETSAVRAPEGRLSSAALESVVSALRTVAPELDSRSLAEALWLASRMDSGASQPPQTAPETAPATLPAPEPPRPGSVPDPRHQDTRPLPSELPVPASPTRTLHERLPESDSPVTGQALALPSASALPLGLPMTRALRPWKRAWPTGRRESLDVAATVDAYARSGELLPVLTPAPERWFDLTLIVDRSPSMHVWGDTVGAFIRMLDGIGAFRTVQVRDLLFAADASVGLTDRRGQPVATRRPGSPDGRRLIVVVSDCAAPAWRAPEVWQRLRGWARTAPLALLNPLPPRLWRRTGLALPTVRVASGTPGGANAGLRFRLPPLLPRATRDTGHAGWLAVPALSLSPHSLERWSRTVMLGAPEGCAAVLVPPGGRPAAAAATRSASRRSSEARTEGFLRTAAPAAARLAVLCSPFDRISLDLLHVLRQELVPEATTADVAEVLSSELFALGTDTAGVVVLQTPREVRARLEQELPEHEALRLGRALGRHVAARPEGQGRMPMVAGGGSGSTRDFTAEATPAGQALVRTLELLGLPGAREQQPVMVDPGPALLHAPAPKPDPTELALRMAMALVHPDSQPSVGDVQGALDAVVSLLLHQGIEVDRRHLARELDSWLAVWEPAADDRRSWYGPDPLPGFGTTFWGRYRSLLSDNAELRRTVDSNTDRLLARLVNPREPGPWLRAGLIVTLDDLFDAPSQTGRTTMLIGLAAKALDVGFRVIVVLADPHNKMRRGTQTQVDEGLLGFDTAYQMVMTHYEPPVRPVGVGTQQPPHPEVAALTSSVSDFTSRRAAQFRGQLGAYPVVLVIKKDRRVVENVRSWFARQTGRPETGADLPLLVVDTTNGSRHTARRGPQPVDEAVHGLLSDFEKSAYVGFSCVPFLPVPLPDGGERHLYADQFVQSLRSSRQDHASTVPAGSPPLLPRIRPITDHEEWLPAGHRADHVPGGALPASLREAVNAFVLAGAVRAARGETGAHNSMLVSVSRFTAVQARVRVALQEYVRYLAAGLRAPDTPPSRHFMEEFDTLGRLDFGLTDDPRPAGESTHPTWAHLAEAVARTDVLLVNSSSKDSPAWHRSRSGLSVIAVGGTKLAQGAALEGLTVGYYLRSTANSETLPQLNSAFGFRTGYEDVCRLYVPPEVLGRRVEEFSGARVQTSRFSLSPDVRRDNFAMLSRFLHALRSRPWVPEGGNLLWREVPPALVMERFLEPYLADDRNLRETLPLLCAYVRSRVAEGELGNWTVQLVNGPGSSGETEVAGHHVGLVERKPVNSPSEGGTYDIRVLHNPRNEYADLDQSQVTAALAATRSAGEEAPVSPDFQALRSVRRPDQVLLTIYLVRPALPDEAGADAPLVGFVVSLPHSAGFSGAT